MVSDLWPRREFLKQAGALAIAPALMAEASPLPKLPSLGADDALLLSPGDALYPHFDLAFNRRKQKHPRLRILCKTEKAVAVAIDWVRENELPFALRSGGHSYEGFSQSDDVVIDTRLMNAVEIDRNGQVSVGAGAALGDIYRALAKKGLALPAGSCPTVGISGHALGGGFGFLARTHGLTCDNLLHARVIDADARIRDVGSESEADLFWALRGGGGGSFGAASQFVFRTYPLERVIVYGMTWELAADRAAKLFAAWQDWAPKAPPEITDFLRLNKNSGGTITLRCAGQSTGLEADLARELKQNLGFEKPGETSIATYSFLGSVNHFSGGWDYESDYSKGKSAYIDKPLGPDAIAALMQSLSRNPPGVPTIVCDAYGGAIAKVAPDETAFSHRAGVLYCMQYGTIWEDASATAHRLQQMDEAYEAIRPYMSGAYVNYCDLELDDWQTAYWGPNYPRLREVKRKFDPANVFRHAQSVR